jgi:hypothetical protein
MPRKTNVGERQKSEKKISQSTKKNRWEGKIIRNRVKKALEIGQTNKEIITFNMFYYINVEYL